LCCEAAKPLQIRAHPSAYPDKDSCGKRIQENGGV
jgi:hypothetical protein